MHERRDYGSKSWEKPGEKEGGAKTGLGSGKAAGPIVKREPILIIWREPPLASHFLSSSLRIAQICLVLRLVRSSARRESVGLGQVIARAIPGANGAAFGRWQ